jgi:hypothetical protein
VSPLISIKESSYALRRWIRDPYAQEECCGVSPLGGAGRQVHDDATEKGEKSVEFIAEIARNAVYEVQLAYTPGGNRADNVPVSIRHAEGEAETTVDQRVRDGLDY